METTGENWPQQRQTTTTTKNNQRLLIFLIISRSLNWGENGVIRVRLGRYMDRLNRAGLNFNLAGSFRSETDFFVRVFFGDFVFKKMSGLFFFSRKWRFGGAMVFWT